MTVGSLFAGIGGFDLGLERAGFSVRWQCECDAYCLRVLEKHWPAVPRYTDVRRLGIDNAPERVDVLCGGFPCQDISSAGFGAGLDGERSGLWHDYARIVGLIRPRYVLVENVAALTFRGLGRVLGDLARLGFDAEWSSLSACEMGFPHPRQRLFIVAYTNGEFLRPGLRDSLAQSFRALQTINDFASARARQTARLAHPSELYRGADGVSGRVDRNRALGNSVVPAIAEWLGQRIQEAERRVA